MARRPEGEIDYESTDIYQGCQPAARRLGDKVTEKVRQLAHELPFAKSLLQHVKVSRNVYRADRPGEKEVLVRNSPDRAVRYYYQVRSNITHRGKGVVRDYELLYQSLAELLPIFREVLKAAEHDAGYSV